jgi:hypothetical protein
MTAGQVGPAPGKSTTQLAPEATVNDWLPCARIPSCPKPKGSNEDARDTFAVRPAQPDSRLRQQRSDNNGLPTNGAAWRPRFTNGAPQGPRICR